MARIGEQCKGCSRAYWERLSQAKTSGTDSGIAADGEPVPEAASRVPIVDANEGTIYSNPERALMNAVSRLTEIQTELSSQNDSTRVLGTATASDAVHESHVDSHVSHHALRQEQQFLSARINAIYKCIGLLESHQKVFKAWKKDYIYDWRVQLKQRQQIIQASYFRSLPYYQILSRCKSKLPGIGDLLQFMDDTFLSHVSSIVTIYELSSGTKSDHIEHEFTMGDPAQLLYHWDILHNPSAPDGHVPKSVVLVDGLDSLTIEILGNALKLHPLVFVRHLWRSLGRYTNDKEWEGYPLSQTPLCSLAGDQPSRIVLDVDEYMSLSSLDGTSLHGLEDLRSIETLGELYVQERWSNFDMSDERDRSVVRENLRKMHRELGQSMSPYEPFVAESARLEATIVELVTGTFFFAADKISDLTYTPTRILSKLELCATATICTITQDSHQTWTRTLVLRTPSRWHTSKIYDKKGTAVKTRDTLFSHNPFETEVLTPLKDMQSRGSVLEALCIVGDLDATTTTQLIQTEVSTIVSLSLLKISVSNALNMAASDHSMLLNFNRGFLYQKDELVKVSDGYSTYLVHRCQRQRDALLLASAFAEKLSFAITGSASPAFNDYVKKELSRVKAITTKTESQLQQTEKVLTVHIDQSFRDLQITLAKTQLEESRKAIKQADTVARLTILAFVFIPISAVCGFFGMNIIEVAADGGFSFWIFGTTMGTVLAMTLLLAFADSIYAMWNYYATKIDDNIFVHTNIGYPPDFLAYNIPYLFQWITLKVKSKIASGQEIRSQNADFTKRSIDRREHV